MENPRFRKDLNDPKTNRPCRRGIEVDIRFFKDRTGKEVLDKMTVGQLKDNSIGFSCDKDPTPGEFQGQKYDYVQRNICIDHLAAPIEQGRCPSPYCGINVDSAEDDKPIVEVQDANLGISYRFDSAKFTPEKAQEWVQKRTHKDCPVCTRIEEVGLLTAAQKNRKQNRQPKNNKNPLPHPTTLQRNNALPQNQRPALRNASTRPQKHQKHPTLYPARRSTCSKER